MKVKIIATFEFDEKTIDKLMDKNGWPRERLTAYGAIIQDYTKDDVLDALGNLNYSELADWASDYYDKEEVEE